MSYDTCVIEHILHCSIVTAHTHTHTHTHTQAVAGWQLEWVIAIKNCGTTTTGNVHLVSGGGHTADGPLHHTTQLTKARLRLTPLTHDRFSLCCTRSLAAGARSYIFMSCGNVVTKCELTQRRRVGAWQCAATPRMR